MKLAAAAIFAALLLPAARASAQIDFSGSWTLDRDISSDLAKASFEPQVQSQARRLPGGRTGGAGGFGGRGGFGGGRRQGQAGGERGADARNAALTDEERLRLREVAAYVKALGSIVIEHTDHSTLTVSDAQGHSRLFPTDGTKAPQAFATATLDSVTKWDGPHLETVYTIDPTHDLVFTYILVPASKQMALRIHLEQSGRPRADVPELRLIYKQHPSTHSAQGPRH